MVGICGVEKSLQAEEALTQGSGCLADDANIGSFVAIALGKLSSLEGFVIQVTRYVSLLFNLDAIIESSNFQNRCYCSFRDVKFSLEIILKAMLDC
jgi:hypothetical protein